MTGCFFAGTADGTSTALAVADGSGVVAVVVCSDDAGADGNGVAMEADAELEPRGVSGRELRAA